MKQILLIVVAVLLLASCSSSKYSAHFQKSDAAFGYHEVIDNAKHTSTTAAPTNLTASTSKEVGIITENPVDDKAAAVEELKMKYQSMNKAEKKAIRKELVREIKKMKTSQASTSTGMTGDPRTWDHDLQLASIFATVGIVALIIGSTFFWVIGAISLIIGVVFGVKWLTQQ